MNLTALDKYALGKRHLEEGALDEALESFRKSLELAIEQRDRPGEGASLNMIGATLDELGRVDEGLKYHRRALPVLEDCGDRLGVAVVLHNLGETSKLLGRTEDAVDYLTRSYLAYVGLGDTDGYDEQRALLAELGIPLQWFLLHFENELPDEAFGTSLVPSGCYFATEDRALFERPGSEWPTVARETIDEIETKDARLRVTAIEGERAVRFLTLRRWLRRPTTVVLAREQLP